MSQLEFAQLFCTVVFVLGIGAALDTVWEILFCSSEDE